ncbi:MAG TPA: DUF5313 family protein [Streptosporangiaceae bacterium]
MTGLPGDPGPFGWLAYALGFRLSKHIEWVRHDLTDAGWRGRMMARHLVVILPICAAFALLPGGWAIRLGTAGLLFLGGVFTVATSTDQLRTARLRQHGLLPPQRPGPPTPTPPDPGDR